MKLNIIDLGSLILKNFFFFLAEWFPGIFFSSSDMLWVGSTLGLWIEPALRVRALYSHICLKLELALSLDLCQKQTIMEPARVLSLCYFISPEMFTRGLLPNSRSIKLLNHYIFCSSQLARMWFQALTVRYLGSVYSKKCLLMFICIKPWRMPQGTDCNM